MKDSRKEPDINIYLDLIPKCKSKWVFLTGGEPLLLNDFEYICKYIKEMNKLIGVTTNGTVLYKGIEKLVHRVGVSIDGNKKYHDQYRDNSFDQAVSFLKSIINKVQTVLMFTLFNENKDQLDFVKSFASSLNVDYLQITKGIS